jgi:multicomponent Na+:H+ antiporter subunit D
VQAYDYLYGAGAALGAVILAGVVLFGYPLLERVPAILLRPVVAALGGLRELHSGHIGDYIAWWTAGAAVLGGTSLIALT